MASLQDLLAIDFKEFCEWTLVENDLYYTPYSPNDRSANYENVLYAFTENNEDNEDGIVRYIGKTTKSIISRFAGYKNPSKEQKTNQRVGNSIREALNVGKKIKILVFTDISPIQWKGYNLNVAAGIEDSLIKTLKPEWNRAGVSIELINTLGEYEDLEIHALGAENENSPSKIDEPKGEILPIGSFNITLGKTYYNKPQGFMNPGVSCDKFFGDHGEHATLHFGTQIARTTINRTANLNGSVRFAWGKDLTAWYQANYRLGDIIPAHVYHENVVKISTSSN